MGMIALFLFSTLGLAAAAQRANDEPAPSTAGVMEAVPGGAFEAAMFYIFGGAAVISAVGVCVSKNVVRMATWLFFSLGAVGVLYFQLGANYIASFQFIVYVGGVLILLIFGVMLTSQSPWVRFEIKRGEMAVFGLICAGLLACLIRGVLLTEWRIMAERAPGIPVEILGRRLVSDYLVPFEAAGVLLMIVMVGAAHLARQEKMR